MRNKLETIKAFSYVIEEGEWKKFPYSPSKKIVETLKRESIDNDYEISYYVEKHKNGVNIIEYYPIREIEIKINLALMRRPKRKPKPLIISNKLNALHSFRLFFDNNRSRVLAVAYVVEGSEVKRKTLKTVSYANTEAVRFLQKLEELIEKYKSS